MLNSIRFKTAALAMTAVSLFAVTAANGAAREEGRLLTATEVLEEVQGMPDQRLPDLLLSRAYGIAIIPDVIKIGLTPVGGRRGHGVLVTRDKLTTPWSNPVFIALTGGNLGFMIGAQSSDIILVFTTKAGIEGIAGGKLTLGADASVAAGPVGRSGSASTDLNFDAEIYSYSRSRGLFAGAALDGSAVTIDRGSNRDFYGKRYVTTTEILSGAVGAPPEAAQRFLDRLAKTTKSAPRPGTSASDGSTTMAPTSASSRPAPAATSPPVQTFPMEDAAPGKEPPAN